MPATLVASLKAPSQPSTKKRKKSEEEPTDGDPGAAHGKIAPQKRKAKLTKKKAKKRKAKLTKKKAKKSCVPSSGRR